MGGAATVIRRFRRQSGSLTANDPKLRLTLPRIRIGCSLAVMAGRYPLVPETVSNSRPDQLGKKWRTLNQQNSGRHPHGPQSGEDSLELLGCLRPLNVVNSAELHHGNRVRTCPITGAVGHERYCTWDLQKLRNLV